MSRVTAAPHWTALAVAICRCSPKLSLRSNCTLRYLMLFLYSISCSSRTIFRYWEDLLSMTAKPRSFQGPFSGICYPTNALPATDFHESSAPGFRRHQRRTRRVPHPRSQWCSFQQVGPCAGIRHTWRSKRVDPPVTLEGRHMSSLLWETIYCPCISPTSRSDSHLAFATSSLEPFSAWSPRCRCSTSRYWTHCVCQCWSTRRIPYAYQFLFMLKWLRTFRSESQTGFPRDYLYRIISSRTMPIVSKRTSLPEDRS